MRIRPETIAGDPDALLRQYLRNRILWWNDQIGRLGDNRVRALDAVLRDARDEVADRLAKDAAGTARLTDWSRERERELADWLDVALAGTGDLVAGTIQGAATAAIVASADAHNSIFSLDGRASAIATVGVSKAQLDAFMEAVSLGDKVAEGMGAARDEMIAALRVNMVRGGGTAEGVRRAIRAATDAGFSLARRHAITMTRTFTQAANTAAMEAVYRANASIIRRVRRVATLDNGTCLACGIADGAAYDFPGEARPSLPAHPRCRCVYVPEAKSWKDFGIDGVRELEEVARPWVIRKDGNIDDGGRRIEKTGKIQGTFQDWWKSLPPELRARTGIGKIRGKLLDSGAVSWDDLWDRSSGRVRSLKELGFGLDGRMLVAATQTSGLNGAAMAVIPQTSGLWSAFRTFTAATPVSEFVDLGANVLAAFTSDPTRDSAAFHAEMQDLIRQVHGDPVEIATINKGGLGVRVLADVAERYPRTWVEASNAVGPMKVVGKYGRRGLCREMKRKISNGKVVYVGEMHLDEFVATGVHEYGHRLQAVFPKMQGIFARLHAVRTAGEQQEEMSVLTGNTGYKQGEVARKDSYIHPYFGREYGILQIPKEVMTMALQCVLGKDLAYEVASGRDWLRDLAQGDMELFKFTVGVIFGWKP